MVGGDGNGDPVQLTIVTMSFETMPGDQEALGHLLGVLANYTVLSRQHPGCRNIDLCLSQTRAGQVLVIEKWESPRAQRDHFDSKEMVDMAEACRPLLARRPVIDLLEGVSAHDLA